jgi:hypothetical protein
LFDGANAANVSAVLIMPNSLKSERKGRKYEVGPQDRQGRDEWAVFKRYGCSNAYLVVQRKSSTHRMNLQMVQILIYLFIRQTKQKCVRHVF